MTDAPVVLVETVGHTMVITLNRPEARNAVNAAVGALVGAAVEAADNDPDIRAIILTGAGDQAFSAGADLKAIMKGEPVLEPGKEHWNFAGFANHFTSKPTIAAVNGNALGGGMELALSCDLIVAAETASFGLPEPSRGLLAGGGGVFRAVQQLPHRIAMKLILTGEPMPADEALRWGLINEVVPAGTALDAALALAAKIEKNAPLAVQGSKRIAYEAQGGVRTDEEARWQHTTEEFLILLGSEDAMEGPTAFAEKRPPVWKAR